ncbi:MAG: formate/nitrite transporter family protein [Chloroflexi bacterium]|nr:formate/nitrite transporter family protein [Chloroflexota bacterium]
MNESNGIDALLPPDIAKRAEQIGIKKADMDAPAIFTLAVLAGAFVGVGAVFATTTISGAAGILPFGVTRLLAGFVFCLGLILIVVAGGELFTGNNLIVMAWASRKVSTQALLRNWVLVYLGNFVGALLTAGLMLLTKQYTAGGGAVGKTALNIANDKVHLEFVQAVALGMMCNALVCVAVWLTYGARSTTDKIMAILFPITAFVSAGFEHSIANMYYVPFGLLIKQFDGDFVRAQGLSVPDLTVQSFLMDNLLPVTIGNIIGGSVMVAIIYWFVYLRAQK